MRSMFVVLALGMLLLGQAQGAEVQPGRWSRAIDPAKLDQALFDEAVLHYSNAARRANGRPPLVADPKLARVASDHARNMARLRTHSHELPVRGQKDLRQRIQRVSLSYRAAAENIAMNKVYRLVGRPISTRSQGCRFTYGDTGAPVPIHSYATLAEEVVAKWLTSPKHRASLLSSKFRRLGSGVAVDPSGPACGDIYMAQDFAD